jgi:hypothetical protein
MPQLGKRPQSCGGIVRSVAPCDDFKAETGPKDGHAARQRHHTGFADAKDSHAHRGPGMHAARQKTVTEKKRLLGLFYKSNRRHGLRL